MKKRKLVSLLIAALITACATVVIAGPEGFMKHPQKPDSSPLAQIDLSSQQAEKIRKVRLAHEKSIAPLMIQKHQINLELNILWLQMDPDKEKITSAQKKINDIELQIMEKETDFRLAIRKVLTREQLSRFLALGRERCHEPDKFDHHPPRLQQPLRF